MENNLKCCTIFHFFTYLNFFLKTFSSAPYALLGKVVLGARVVREPGKKWYLSNAQYGANMLPSYLNGPAYVFTGSLIPSLISCAMRCNL